MTAERSRAFNAVLEHHRCWVFNDGACLRSVDSDGLAPPIAYTIAKYYGVARNIGNRERVAELAGAISAVTDEEWQGSLVSREKLCRNLGEAHKKGAKGKKHHLPISGITKLMWFLRPDGWTMFDSLACKGLVGANKGSFAFYEKLDQCGFIECAATITNECRALDLPLFGERVIDKFLMLRGMSLTDYRWAAALNEMHFALIPRERQEQLERLARFVEGLDLDRQFPPPTTQRRGRASTLPDMTPGTPA